MGKTTALFFVLFVAGHLILRTMQSEGLTSQAMISSVVVGAVAAAIFAAVQWALHKRT